MSPHDGGGLSSVLSKCVAGGLGCGPAGFLTNPMDVIKVRNQQFADARFGSVRSTAISILEREGLRGFYKGAATSVLREFTYSSLRMGLYEPIKAGYSTALGADDADSIIVKWASAFTSGAIGSAIFNPLDVVKVRFQAAPESPPYSSIPNAIRTIYGGEGGLRGLYVGTSATITRAAFLTSAQLGSYDVVKNNVFVRALGLDREARSTHFAASFIASLITTTAANPADVVKTRVMNDSSRVIGGPRQHVAHIWKTHGPAGFLKGWTASYLRIGPHTVISLVLIEKVRQMMGMMSY